ncbi:MAG: hypothetical protein K9M80_08115 [Candidatus Marinimicrobia bacterium]|nr:hypothetical protein [Candidatus Neomarinimicrobiota bacterium]
MSNGNTNRDSAIRFIGAICMEQSEEWLTGRRYLTFDKQSEVEKKPIVNKEENVTNNLILQKI